MRILELQRAGRQAMEAEDFLRGTRLPPARGSVRSCSDGFLRPAGPQVAETSCSAMPRYKLTIEYDGRPFVGWQIQDNGPTVQAALSRRCRNSAARWCTCTARAAPMPACMRSARWRMSISPRMGADNVRDALNAHLRPHPVAVFAAEQVPDTFDARFSAMKRHYLYRIVNRRADLTFENGRAWRVAKRSTAAPCTRRTAADRQSRLHDLPSSECQAKSPVKTLDRLDVLRAEGRVPLMASARSFLHTQVRSMVGARSRSARAAGRRRCQARALARSRCLRAGAPAEGLYLVKVDYDEEAGLDAARGGTSDAVVGDLSGVSRCWRECCSWARLPTPRIIRTVRCGLSCRSRPVARRMCSAVC